MINHKEISLDWISQVSKKNRNADKILVEKVIRALQLLEGLSKELSFIFKGGTALMLHLNSTKRLSIDIDIILPNEVQDLELVLDKVANEQGFLRKEVQHRNTASKIKKEHYKFFYLPLHKTNKDEEYVLLDILYEEINYSKIYQLPIQSTFIPVHGESINVSMPSMEDILGDKLTAFAPNTTGIPYFKKEDSMSMEIIKQLYDIGNLFDNIGDIIIVKETFIKFANTELKYRDSEKLTEKDVLNDILKTSLCIATRGVDGKGNYEELSLGIQRVSRFIFSESYHIEKAITHASKAAYCSALIYYNAKYIERFSDPIEIKEWTIDETLSTKLNKLKKSNPEAFFYWYKVYELITIQELRNKQNPLKVPIKKSMSNTEKIVDSDYIPLIEDVYNKVIKFGSLFEQTSWAYLEEPGADKKIPMKPKSISLNDLRIHLRKVARTPSGSSQSFKALFYFMNYTDENKFSFEISFKLHLYETSWQIEFFVGRVHGGSLIGGLINEIINNMNKDGGSTNRFESGTKFMTEELEYGAHLNNATIKESSGKISKIVLDFIRMKSKSNSA
jgi:predicted nucleotidyltransferase component of viral defense system